jgi:hypothetical protein
MRHPACCLQQVQTDMCTPGCPLPYACLQIARVFVDLMQGWTMLISGESQGLRGPDVAADTWLLVLHPRLASTRSLERFRNQVRFLSAQTYQSLSLPRYKTLKIHHRAPIKQVSPRALLLCPAAVGFWQCWLQMTRHAPGPRRFPLIDNFHWGECCVVWLGGDAALDGGQFRLGGGHV